jgi:hypothetical protein
MNPSIPSEVARKLGFYVYVLIHPDSGMIFYVGKGRLSRILTHLSEEGESHKNQIIKELLAAGLVPRMDILAHGLPSEEVAMRIEAAVIDLLGLGALTNQVRGWRSVQFGRKSLEELKAYYAAVPVKIHHPVLLIRINQLYRDNMNSIELYESTRGVWKLGERRHKAKYALAVFEGVVRAVYEIGAWHPAGSMEYKTRALEDVRIPGRWEFAEPKDESEETKAIRVLYNKKRVDAYFKKGMMNPVVYVNI